MIFLLSVFVLSSFLFKLFHWPLTDILLLKPWEIQWYSFIIIFTPGSRMLCNLYHTYLILISHILQKISSLITWKDHSVLSSTIITTNTNTYCHHFFSFSSPLPLQTTYTKFTLIIIKKKYTTHNYCFWWVFHRSYNLMFFTDLWETTSLIAFPYDSSKYPERFQLRYGPNYLNLIH